MAAGCKINRDSYPGRLVSLLQLLPLFFSVHKSAGKASRSATTIFELSGFVIDKID